MTRHEGTPLVKLRRFVRVIYLEGLPEPKPRTAIGVCVDYVVAPAILLAVIEIVIIAVVKEWVSPL